MITVPADPRLHPDIVVNMYGAADALTGDGVFSNTDLIRIPYDGWLLVYAATSAVGISTIQVPQIGHQENAGNNIPVLNGATTTSLSLCPMYKIPIQKGQTPRILIDLTTDTIWNACGMFYRGMQNPVALNTPDIMVMRNLTASASNVLTTNTETGGLRSDLEDCPYPGWLYTWASSSVVDGQIQVSQAGHRPGNYSLIPKYWGGIAINVLDNPPFKVYVPETGQPTVTYTEVTAASAFFVSCLYIDWANVPKSIKTRMGL